jgi:hypothetical protein
MPIPDDSLFEKDSIDFSPTEGEPPKFSPRSGDAVYDAWLSSRYAHGYHEPPLVPGAQRPLNRTNLRLAYTIAAECAWDLFQLLWSLHPLRAAAMVTLNVIRGLFPAFKGYSQALIINEVGQRQVTALLAVANDPLSASSFAFIGSLDLDPSHAFTGRRNF